MKKLALIASLALAFPLVSFAQDPALSTVRNMVNAVREIVNVLIPIVFGLGVLAFFWGLVRYLFAADHDKDQAKKTMLWGIVAIFVMASVWGLVRFIGSTFGVNTDNSAISPNVDLPNVSN